MLGPSGSPQPDSTAERDAEEAEVVQSRYRARPTEAGLHRRSRSVREGLDSREHLQGMRFWSLQQGQPARLNGERPNEGARAPAPVAGSRASGDAQEGTANSKLGKTMIGAEAQASGAPPCPDLRRQLQLSVGTIPEGSALCEQPCTPAAPVPLSTPSVYLAVEEEAGPCTPERTAEPQRGCWGSWEVPCSAGADPLLKQGSPARRPAGRRRAAVLAAILSLGFVAVLLASTAWPIIGEWTLVGASGPPQPQARGSLLCEPCVHACGPLVAAQHSSHVAPDALRAALGALPAGAPLACQAGLCVPSSGADLTAACQGRAELTAGLGPGSSGDDMHRELLEVEEEQQQQQGDLIESRGRRKLLMQGSQRQLTHVGREQVRLLNRWTHAFARRVAQETDAPPANVPPVTLAAAEAPYADPFLMEFEDQTALSQAYSEAPMTFEQALLAARLEAKQAAETGSNHNMVKSVALDDISSALNGFLDSTAEPASTAAAAGGVSRGAPLRRGGAASGGAQASQQDDAGESLAEPAAPRRRGSDGVGGVRPSNRAGVRTAAQSGVDLSGINVKVLGVSKPQANSAPLQKCYVLGYNQGYANLSTTHYLAVKNTANKGACCTLCSRDSRCVAWTRVAGGREDVRTCYLKDTLQRDSNMDSFAYSYAPPYLHRDWPEVRYIVETVPVILESGTKQQSLPGELYGCPYPPNPASPGACVPPPLCNCVAGICYGSCKGGVAGERS